ncbi:MAG: GNAT family N-acetyltransferase [Peptococcaceae bacterium]|nr:GNAT family N-acetyltransferase [Peptococcaceae bacterium]
MIRKAQAADLDQIADLWLAANIDAHDFIDASYWQSMAPLVRGLLAQSELTIFEAAYGGRILGFVGLDGDQLQGLFVDADVRGQGLGRQLLDAAKKDRAHLSLHAYAKNTRACAFYSREGFIATGEDVDAATGEREVIFEWQASAI